MHLVYGFVFFQNEVQAAHWCHDQVTVHPSVTYYPCQNACGKVMTESLVFISSDLKHDFHAVHHFTGKALSHLRDVRGLVIDRVLQWTDGCASQYKSKGPFADIAHAPSQHQAAMERSFFGSRHGKGPSDGESAVVKGKASKAIKADSAVISTAKEMYEYCQSALTLKPEEDVCPENHFLRTFFWVGEDDIIRERGERNVKTLPGTRKFHCVRSNSDGGIQARHLTCYCDACITGTGQCSSQEAGDWTTFYFG